MMGVLFSTLSCTPKVVRCSISPDLSEVDQTQLQQDEDSIDMYLAEHNITDYKTDKSGVRYRVITKGSKDEAPTLCDNVKVSYKGWLLKTGVLFDSNTSLQMDPSRVITGWQVMLVQMHPGETREMYIPSGLAYGTRAAGPIPANANLYFQVTLERVY